MLNKCLSLLSFRSMIFIISFHTVHAETPGIFRSKTPVHRWNVVESIHEIPSFRCCSPHHQLTETDALQGPWKKTLLTHFSRGKLVFGTGDLRDIYQCWTGEPLWFSVGSNFCISHGPHLDWCAIHGNFRKACFIPSYIASLNFRNYWCNRFV